MITFEFVVGWLVGFMCGEIFMHILHKNGIIWIIEFNRLLNAYYKVWHRK